MKTLTGLGYFKDSQGHITGKYDLPKGEHPLRPGYTFHDLPDREALNKIIVYTPPKTLEKKRAEQIYAETLEIAKQSLIAKGEWV